MNKRLVTLLAIGCAFNCLGGELTKGSTVLEVASNGSNAANFAVKVTGGTGLCSGWIYFPEVKVSSITTYNQSFTLATMALAADKKVRIHNYSDNSCTGADFISVSK
jgi:hypothetical protein